MRLFYTAFAGILVASIAAAQTAEEASPTEDSPTFLTETGCASCSYKMPGVRGCQTAVKLDGKAYLLEGVETNAHADGLCDATKFARIAGKVHNGRFVATHYEIDESASAEDLDTTMEAELGCGSCMYSMEGVRGCKTAVKIGEGSYLLKGIDIDAHATGLCNGTQPARVAGEIRDGAFVASIVILEPAKQERDATALN